MQIDKPTISDFTNSNHNHRSTQSGGIIQPADLMTREEIGYILGLAASLQSQINTLSNNTVAANLFLSETE